MIIMTNFKAAVIGLGGVSPMHIKSLQAVGISIAAVCDKDMAKAEKIGLELGAVAYSNYEEMLAAVTEQLQALGA